MKFKPCLVNLIGEKKQKKSKKKEKNMERKRKNAETQLLTRRVFRTHLKVLKKDVWSQDKRAAIWTQGNFTTNKKKQSVLHKPVLIER